VNDDPIIDFGDSVVHPLYFQSGQRFCRPLAARQNLG
jgi:hypothetical protein